MPELTPNERKLLKLICEDKNNMEIADKLQYSLRYTEKIKSALYAKTKTKSNIGLLKWAVVNHLYTIKMKSKA